MSDIPSLKLDVKKDAWNQLQSGSYKITLTINPADLSDNRFDDLVRFLKAPMGQRYAAVLVEISDDEQPVAHNAFAGPENREDPEPLGEPLPDKPNYTAQAGMLCKEPLFWRFLRESPTIQIEATDEESAADAIRYMCLIDSRRGLNSNSRAAKYFRSIVADFENWKACRV